MAFEDECHELAATAHGRCQGSVAPALWIFIAQLMDEAVAFLAVPGRELVGLDRLVMKLSRAGGSGVRRPAS